MSDEAWRHILCGACYWLVGGIEGPLPTGVKRSCCICGGHATHKYTYAPQLMNCRGVHSSNRPVGK